MMTKDEVALKLEQLTGESVDADSLSRTELEQRLAKAQSEILPGVHAAEPADVDLERSGPTTQADPRKQSVPAVENPADRTPDDGSLEPPPGEPAEGEAE